jgi:dTDP-4-dehydrorhamnose reductase
MRILVTGATGTLGHRVLLAARAVGETWATVRRPVASAPWAGLFEPGRTIVGVDAADPSSLDQAMRAARPDLVINAIGRIKQRPDSDDPGPAFLANSRVPHHLAARCDAAGARLIQVSTDCVFVGDRGGYREADPPDALDTYGLTKRLGEVGAPHLTVRTSLVGRSLAGTDGLLEWLLAQRGPVRGFRCAVFSGLGTPDLAETLVAIGTRFPELAGLWHVAGEPIDKHSLLERFRSAFGVPVTLEPVDTPVIDRSLDDRRFREATGLRRPAWDAMIERLARDPLPYAAWRNPG